MTKTQSKTLDLQAKQALVVDHLDNIDPTDLDIWSDLDILSTHTIVDDIEIDPAGIVIEGNQFSGVFNIYVTLQYGVNGEEGFATSDSFLARFSGHFESEVPVIDQSEVDTSSFYEDDNLT